MSEKTKHRNTEIRSLIIGAKLVSTLFRPMYYPVLGWIALFSLTTPLSLFPYQYKLIHLAILILFTIILPMTLTLIYRHVRHLDPLEMRKRTSRIIPYIMFIACYVLYLYLMRSYYIDYKLLAVIIVALLIQVVCTFMSFFWKVSVHAAGSGAIIGGIAAFSFGYVFNHLLWLSGAILLAGLVGTSRMILRQHNLSQIVVGYIVGALCGFAGILFGSIFLFGNPF